MLYKSLQLSLVLIVGVVLNACSAEKSLEILSDVSSDNHFEKTANVSYGSDPRQRMDFYQPSAEDGASPDSGITVVFVYGGAWRSGSKDGYEFVASSLTKAGHRVLIPDYRLYPQVRFPDFIDDVAQAIATLEQSAFSQQDQSSDSASDKPSDKAPIEKLVLMGHSSGAHQAALLLTDPTYLDTAGVKSQVSGFIGLSGPYDLPLELEEVSVVFPDIKDPVTVNPVLQARAMDADALSGIDVLLLHGEKDERVLPFHTQRFAEALEGTGATVTLHTLKGGHAAAVLGISGPLEFLNGSLEHVLEFLKGMDPTSL